MNLTAQLLDKIRMLANLPIDDLRVYYTGFGCDYTPSVCESRGYTAGLSRGELVAGIIAREWDHYGNNAAEAKR